MKSCEKISVENKPQEVQHQLFNLAKACADVYISYFAVASSYPSAQPKIGKLIKPTVPATL